MRIIGGTARGRSLVAPDGRDTRPTRDMVREALFDILTGRVEGALVLDAFAGSGALALEAVSRGAAAAVMAERSTKAIAVIRRNIASVGMAERTRLIALDWERAARTLRSEGARFDLIMLDPPYAWPDTRGLLAAAATLAVPGAWITLEHGRGDPPDPPDGLTLVKSRSYGDTTLSFYEVPETLGS
ncbi:MAG: 16S rRNA (guanine(966)-N(2))-methyltransferase RsmD [Oscillospiraceae bacterium]|nr:16S rRNA (guanine(966)-N(2))-methyltransferase RsmD [Oscillospiraceae bacterium]